MYKPGNYPIGQLQIGNVTFVGVTAGVYSRLQESLDKKIARVGVFGNAFDTYSPSDIKQDFDKIAYNARLIGELIAREGLIFVNGACPGIPNIAAQGARAKKGVITGFSPLQDETTHLTAYGWSLHEIPHFLITYLGRLKNKQKPSIASRLFITRDVANIFACDAVIAIGGFYGTNHEIAIAAELGLPVMLLKGTGGVADMGKQYYESIRKPGNSAVFIEEEDPKILVERMLDELFKRDVAIREFRPGRDPLDTIIQRIEMQQAA